MNKEDLFLAIGQAESSRLARSEWTVSSRSPEEDKTMKTRPTRVMRNLLIAAVIVSMLAVTAYAVAGFLIYDSPENMISTIFGDKTGFDHAARGEILDMDGNVIAVQPRHDRVPADEEVVAEEVAPMVSPVGQSLSWAGYTVTVDANLYDAATKCGLLTYTLENPDGVDYELYGNGEISDVVSFGQYGRKYIIQ